MNQEQIAADVEGFLRVRFRIDADDERFSRQAHLWEEGYVDSIGIVELIAHIESSFDLSLPDEVLFDQRFTSVDGIASIVGALLEERAA